MKGQYLVFSCEAFDLKTMYLSGQRSILEAKLIDLDLKFES